MDGLKESLEHRALSILSEDMNEQLESMQEGAEKLAGKVTFTLDDGEVLNRENPHSFRIPPKERRGNLVKDDIVKLVSQLTDGEQTQGERMWVIVTGGDRSGYTGTLDNDPYCTDHIKAGLEVSFEPRHVIDIYDDESPGIDEAEKGRAEPSPTKAEPDKDGDGGGTSNPP